MPTENIRSNRLDKIPDTERILNLWATTDITKSTIAERLGLRSDSAIRKTLLRNKTDPRVVEGQTRRARD